MFKGIIAVLSLTLSIPVVGEEQRIDEAKLNAIEQLPIACDNYIKRGYTNVQACFPAVVGNRITDLDVKGLTVQQFNSLSWPVSARHVGLPDLKTKFDTTYDTYPVWQSWMTLNDFYVLDDKEDMTWFSSRSSIPQSCKKLVAGDEKGNSRLSEFLVKHKSVPVGPKVQVLTMDKTASGHRVYDEQKNKLKFQVYFNNVAYNSLLEYEDEIKLGGVKFKSGTFNGVNDSERGAIFVKAAWKILQEDNTDLHRTVSFVVNDETETCELELVGLVGLHIVSRDIPSNLANAYKGNLWTWSTYEYKHNSPTTTEFDDGSYLDSRWLFFSKEMSKEEIENQCFYGEKAKLSNYKVADKTSCVVNNPNIKPSVILSNDYGEFSDDFPVDPESPILNTVWKNYTPVGVQWSEGGVLMSTAKNKRTDSDDQPFLANNVLEPYTPLSGCSQCHTQGNKTQEGELRNEMMFLNDNTRRKEGWVDFNLLTIRKIK
ncbi:hypothetical protein MD535_05260 [Vibrio sp. ZSDZ65]|uniref:Cytochrome c family protein n=1 Tax=Vibrio qingdaonensis TaxID=2829491 RepID=A0A9X3HVM7_9VIBR|nr:hypothetical protein [Vibrio qingdaonensis]MCW8345439.1 hypothetical protein [Vibrio qingdaonensis]